MPWIDAHPVSQKGSLMHIRSPKKGSLTHIGGPLKGALTSIADYKTSALAPSKIIFEDGTPADQTSSDTYQQQEEE